MWYLVRAAQERHLFWRFPTHTLHIELPPPAGSSFCLVCSQYLLLPYSFWNVKVIHIWFHPAPMPLACNFFSLLFFQVMFTARLQMEQKSLNVWPSVKGQPNQLPSCIYFTLFKPSCRVFLTIHSTMFPQHTRVKWMKPLVLYSWVATLLSGTADTCFCFCLLNAKRGKLYFSSGRISIRKSPHTWELIITWKTWLKCNH